MSDSETVTNAKSFSVKQGYFVAAESCKGVTMKAFQLRLVLVFLVTLLVIVSCAEVKNPPRHNSLEQLPVIDVHVHIFHGALDPNEDPDIQWGMDDWFGGPKAPASLQAYFEETYGLFRKYNVKAVVSSRPELVEKWRSQDKDNRIIPGLLMLSPTSWGMTPARFETMVRSGEIKVFGELAPYYTGGTICDPGWKPYLEVCEKYDVPVAVHTGGGLPGRKNTWREESRLRFGDPYLIEDVLVEYPNLRINMCHSGAEHDERALALMSLYPQVYCDLAAMVNFGPQSQRLCRAFLIKAKNDGLLDRVMFGSDVFLWPHHLEIGLEYIHSLEVLTEKEKRDILYNNAARGLRLEQPRREHSGTT